MATAVRTRVRVHSAHPRRQRSADRTLREHVRPRDRRQTDRRLHCAIEEQELAADAVESLEGRGYWVSKDWKNRTVLRRAGADSLQFNLHLCWPETIPEIRGNLAFREYLREHPSMRDRYGEVKLDAADEFPNDIGAYYVAKNSIIEEIMECATEEGYLECVDVPSK